MFGRPRARNGGYVACGAIGTPGRRLRCPVEHRVPERRVPYNMDQDSPHAGIPQAEDARVRERERAHRAKLFRPARLFAEVGHPTPRHAVNHLPVLAQEREVKPRPVRHNGGGAHSAGRRAILS